MCSIATDGASGVAALVHGFKRNSPLGDMRAQGP